MKLAPINKLDNIARTSPLVLSETLPINPTDVDNANRMFCFPPSEFQKQILSLNQARIHPQKTKLERTKGKFSKKHCKKWMWVSKGEIWNHKKLKKFVLFQRALPSVPPSVVPFRVAKGSWNKLGSRRRKSPVDGQWFQRFFWHQTYDEEDDSIVWIWCGLGVDLCGSS